MKWFFQSLNSSIGKKIVMAVSGICLLLFLLGHFVGNLQLFNNDAGVALNNYAMFLKQFGPIITLIEIILAIILVLHMINAVWLYFINKFARPEKYAVNASAKNSTWSSRTMIWSGSIIFIFVVIHLKNFWYEFAVKHATDNLYELVVNTFKDPVYSGIYIFAMILMFFHLNHGFQSAFQTFGWNHKKYTPLINFLGAIYSFLMAAGFASMPIYFLFFHGGN